MFAKEESHKQFKKYAGLGFVFFYSDHQIRDLTIAFLERLFS